MALGKNQVMLTFAGDSRDLERAFDRVGNGARQMDRQIDRAGSNLTTKSNKWGKNIAAFAKTAAFGLAAVGVAAGAAVVSFISAAEEAQKVTRQTNAVIESMGNVAGISARGVADLAEALALKTGVDDELIQSGENVLLTFARVRDEVGRGNDVFTRATTVALDMSVALGQDMQASIVQVGKALNDPIAGLTALGRVGVQFTEDQKALITALVESGDVLGAQKVILQELETQFAGSAEAQATATDKMRVAFDNLQEQIGTALLPAFEKITTWITEKGIPGLQKVWAWIQVNIVPVFRKWWDVTAHQLGPALANIAGIINERLIPQIQRLFGWSSKTEGAVSLFSGTLRVLGGIALGLVFAWTMIADGLAMIARLAAFAKEQIEALIRAMSRLAAAKNATLSAASGASSGPLKGIFGVLGAHGGIVSPHAIQRFAGGGVASMGPRGSDTVPAWLSPGEMVLTKQDQRNLLGIIGSGGGRGGSSTTIVNVQGSILSERDLIKLVGNEIRKGGFDGAGFRVSRLVFVDSGEQDMSEGYIAVLNISGGLSLRLFTNDVTAGLTPGQIDALDTADFTVATFPGYASITFNSGWTTTPGNPTISINTPRTFTRSSTGTAQLIRGYYLVAVTDGVLQWFEQFDAPVSLATIGDAIVVTPKFTNDDTGGNAVISGTITAFGGSTAPTGWLLCDGTAVSRSTFVDLFNTIGTTYGVGDGATTFNLPDLRQRFPLGKAASGTGVTMGSTGGAIDHTHGLDTATSHAKIAISSTGPTTLIRRKTVSSYTANFDLTGNTFSTASASFTVGTELGGTSGTNNAPYQVVQYIVKT